MATVPNSGSSPKANPHQNEQASPPRLPIIQDIELVASVPDFTEFPAN